MDHLPIFINIRKKPCIVIGGGDIALRKINLLLKKTFVCSLIHLGQERSFYNDDIKWDEFYFDLPMYEKMGIQKFKLVAPHEEQQRTALMYKRNHQMLANSAK